MPKAWRDEPHAECDGTGERSVWHCSDGHIQGVRTIRCYHCEGTGRILVPVVDDNTTQSTSPLAKGSA